MSNNEVLFRIFAGTLEADKTTREAAEHALTQLSVQQPELVVRLLEFACDQPLSQDTTTTQYRSVQLACAIRVRNVLGRGDWNRLTYFTESVKAEVRRIIVPLQCEPHVSELVRRQLLATASELVRCDYPARWPELVPQLGALVDASVSTLQGAAVGVDPTAAPSSSADVHAALLRLRGALGVLRCCCQISDDPLQTDAEHADAFAARFLPALLSLCAMLKGLWSGEAARVQHLEQQEQGRHAHGPASIATFSPLLTELSHCMRMVLKCCMSLCTSRFPLYLCGEAAFMSFWASCVAGPAEVMTHGIMPLTRARLTTYLHSPHADHGSDYFQSFQQSAEWRLFKWIQNLSYKLVQEFVSPKSCEARARKVATLFSQEYLLPAVAAALNVVRWHAEPVGLTSKAYIMALEVLTLAVTHKRAYTEVLHPCAEEVMTILLFPRLCFSSEDAELWQFNPEEYVRKQSSPGGDLFNPKVVSASLLLSLAVPAKKFQDKQLLPSLVNFIMNQLQVYSASAARATHESARSDPAAFDAARRVDAALYCLYQFKNVLTTMNFGDEHIEHVLSNYVVPATRYPLGFLRARAVLVLSAFALSIHWSSPAAYQDALRGVLPLLNDPEAPVRVQTCVSFSRLTRHPHAREVITPCIAELIQHYFNVMRLMDNEAVVRTLRKTISYYHDTLSLWALELTDMITTHFATVLRSVSGKYAVLSSDGDGAQAADMLEDDGFADTLMAADELLETLTTLVRSLPESTALRGTSDVDALNTDMFMQLQYRISPVLFTILSHTSGSTYGFMDPVLRLLTTLLSRSPAVAPQSWQLLPCLYRMVVHGGAADYFGQMLAPLDNYVSVEPLPFLFTPLHTLTDGAMLDGELAALTPGQILLRMCESTLTNPDLRSREIACVPKLYDSMLQSYWAASSPLAVVAPDGAAVMASGGGGGCTAAPSAAELVMRIGRTALVTAGTRPRQSSTLRILLANSLFSCLLADAGATAQVLSSLQATTSFFEQYVYLVMTGPHAKEVQGVLRSYDRSLLALAVSSVIRLLDGCGAAADPAVATAASSLLPPLCAVVECGLLGTLAEMEVASCAAEMTAVTKAIQRRSAAAAAAANGDSEDMEDWEDNSDFDDGDTDDEDDCVFSENDDDTAGEWDDVNDGGLGGQETIRTMVQQARALRTGSGVETFGVDDDDGDGDDNLLDDDDDFDSPISAVNAWEVLASCLSESSSSAAVLFGEDAHKWQAQALVQARDATAQVVVLRAQLVEVLKAPH